MIDRPQEGEGEETLVSGSAPKFIRLPTDLLVAEGEDAVFECAVTGEPKPDLRWHSTDDGEVIHDGRIIVSAFIEENYCLRNSLRRHTDSSELRQMKIKKLYR